MTFWVAGAIVVGSGVNAYAANKAANTQSAAADRAAQLQYQQFQEANALQKPFRDVGVNALPELVAESKYTPFGMEQFKKDPGYGFRLSEGVKALDASAAARGGLLSGNTGRALTQYGQDMASQEYTNAFNRYLAERNARLNPLQSLAGMAQTTTNQMANAGQNMASNVGEAYMGGANARASSYIGGANALTSGLGTYLNYNQGQNMINALRGGGGGGGASRYPLYDAAGNPTS